MSKQTHIQHKSETSGVFYAYLVCIFISPLPFALNRLWAWSSFASVSFLLLFFVLKHQKNAWQTINPSSRLQIKLLSLLAIWVLLQAFLLSQTAPFDILLSAIKTVFFISFFILGSLLITHREQAVTLMFTIVITAMLQASYGAFMTLSGIEIGFFVDKTSYLGKATGTFVNRNHFAGYLELALAVSIGLMMTTETHFVGNAQKKFRQTVELLLSKKALTRLGIIIMVIALVLSRSRMGNSAFFIGLLSCGGLTLLLMHKKSTSLIILLVTLVLFDVAILSTFFGVKKVAERIQQTQIEHESRDEVALDSLEMFLDKPLTGHGLGSFKYVYPNYRDSKVKSEHIYDHAHNDYMQFLLELGIVPFLMLIWVVLISLKNALLCIKQTRSSLKHGMAFSCLMGITVIAIHSTVDFNLQIPANTLLFMIVLTLGNASYHHKFAKK